jgi:DNA polymerase III sliding clamp (beta) subunit (PCNA family)
MPRSPAACAVRKSTDGSRRKTPTPAESGNVSQQFRALVPKKAMAELVKLSDEAGGDTKAIFAGDDNHLFFR